MANDTSSIRNASVNRAALNKNEAATPSDAQAVTVGLKNGCGMKGAPDPAVNALQATLNEQTGAGLKCDGKFGPKTEAAVRAFQEANGCPVTGTVDAETLAKIQGKAAPTVAEAATPNAAAEEPAAANEVAQPQVKASQAEVDQSRSKMKSREELMRARVEAAERAEGTGQAFEVVTDKNVQATLEGVTQMKGSLDEQRRSVSQTRLGVQNDIRQLAGKKNRTEPEEMLLTGKRQQDEVLGQLEKHIDTKKQIVEAAGTAVSDGVLTESENDGIAKASSITQRMEQVLATKARAADQVVASAEALGAAVPARSPATDTKPVVDRPTVNNEPATKSEPAGPRRGLANANKPAVANANEANVANANVANAPVKSEPAAVKKAEESFAQLSDAQVNDAVTKVAQGVGPKKGTAVDAQKILGAVEGMSPNQLKQVEDAYNKKYAARGFDFKKDAVGSMYPHNQKAFAALGDTSKTQAERTAEFTKLKAEGAKIDHALKNDAIAIRDAVKGMGTDETKLFDTLGKYAGKPEQRDLLMKEYARQFPGRTLKADVSDDVSSDVMSALKASKIF